MVRKETGIYKMGPMPPKNMPPKGMHKMMPSGMMMKDKDMPMKGKKKAKK